MDDRKMKREDVVFPSDVEASNFHNPACGNKPAEYTVGIQFRLNPEDESGGSDTPVFMLDPNCAETIGKHMMECAQRARDRMEADRQKAKNRMN